VLLTGGHAPAPLQPAAATAAPPLQLAVRHEVVALGYEHDVRVVPSQVPPHSEPSLAHALREPVGAPVTAVHVPSEPLMPHDSH